MIPRLRSFESLIGKLRSSTNSGINAAIIPTTSKPNSVFRQLPYQKREEIISAIKSLQLYATNNMKSADRRRRLFKMMSWRQQNLCKQAGYLEKLDIMDVLLKKNQLFLNEVVESSINAYEISFSDFDIIKNFVDSSSYRVIESLTHFNRDWNMDQSHDEFELGPVIKFIETQLSQVIPNADKPNTCIVVPGSGLGRIPYELARKGYGQVHSVEFSGLMYLFNQFVYSNKESSLANLEVYPYVHTNSNFESIADQSRSILIPQLQQPTNLSMHLEDFNTFELPDPGQCKNVVIVTAFFIDTAENLMDYLDSINSLVKPFRNSYWINIGPLKYGSAPKVELNMDELAHLRTALGWTDLTTINTLKQPISEGENGLYSYATDKHSLWQGYYGLTGWCSKK
ncbi:N2227-domain-containing protein [Yamadazyma tenuis]|nr:N2227-domain-containing protein [Yamadazyma tenuis]